MIKGIIAMAMAIALSVAAIGYAAGIPNGYGGTKWGTHLHKVMNAYPKGQMGEYNGEIIYTQENPDKTIAKRIFSFKDGKLTGVAVTFNADYVKKTGLENLQKKYIQQYGEGKEGGESPSMHMTTYLWEGPKTVVKFIYVPNRPEMTILQYDRK